jgi:signal transduction histidine kinase
MVAVDVVAPGVLPESRAGAVDILVRNTGPVIAAERLGEVFTPFKGTKDSAHFGLGLTTAAMALAKMGATIGVKSGGGATTFWVSVPVAG